MRSPRRCLEPGTETHNKVYVGPRHREVEEGANHALVLSLVHLLAILIGVQSGCRRHRRRHWLSISHIKLLQQVLYVLRLLHKHTILALFDLDAEKEGQLTHHQHLKLSLHHFLKSRHKSMR